MGPPSWRRLLLPLLILTGTEWPAAGGNRTCLRVGALCAWGARTALHPLTLEPGRQGLPHPAAVRMSSHGEKIGRIPLPTASSNRKRRPLSPSPPLPLPQAGFESLLLHVLQPDDSSAVVANHLVRSMSALPSHWPPGRHAECCRQVFGMRHSTAWVGPLGVYTHRQATNGRADIETSRIAFVPPPQAAAGRAALRRSPPASGFPLGPAAGQGHRLVDAAAGGGRDAALPGRLVGRAEPARLPPPHRPGPRVPGDLPAQC